jgi:hypothetical protein
MALVAWGLWAGGLGVWLWAAARSQGYWPEPFPKMTAAAVGRGADAFWWLLTLLTLIPATAFPERALQRFDVGLLIDVAAALGIFLVLLFRLGGARPPGSWRMVERRRRRWAWALFSAIAGQIALGLVGGPAVP